MSELPTYSEEEMLMAKMKGNMMDEQDSTGEPTLKLNWTLRTKIINHLVDQSRLFGGQDKDRLFQANNQIISELLNLPIAPDVCETCSDAPTALNDLFDDCDEDLKGLKLSNKVLRSLKSEVKASVANEIAKKMSGLKDDLIGLVERSIGLDSGRVYNYKLDDIRKILPDTSKNYRSDWFVVRCMKWRINAHVYESKLSVRLEANRSDVYNISCKAEIAFNLINQDTGPDYSTKPIYYNFFANSRESLWSTYVEIPLSEFEQPSKGFLKDGSIIVQAVVKVDDPAA